MRAIFGAAVFLLVLFLGIPLAVMKGAQRSQPQTRETEISKGRYLVEEVAKCTECHTPRDSENQLDRGRWLQGAPIWIEPVHPVPNWAQFAPTLAGLPSMTDEQMERVLEHGESANGREIEPPMHIYHLTHSDALAIIAYLRSLPSPSRR